MAPDPACVLTLSEELDMASAAQLGTRVVELLTRGERNVVLDFRDVRLIDSAAIGVLLSAQRRVHAVGGVLAVANTSEHVRHVFELTGVGRKLSLT